jgi:hypothetical protein
MAEYPELIDPGEPIIPERIPIEICPGPNPTRRPLEPDPSRKPLTLKADPPEPIYEPQPEPLPGGADQPPGKPPKTTVGTPAMPDDDPETATQSQRSKSRTAKKTALCVFKPVDEISQYNSFRSGIHPPDRTRPFGLVVSLEGYSCYVAMLRDEYPDHSENDCRSAAWRFILNHQIHHFLVDRAVSTLEMAFQVAGRPLGHNIWQQFHLAYRTHPDGCSPLEESLCCAYSRRNCGKGLARLTQALIKKQPIDYRQQSSDGKKIIADRTNLSHGQGVSLLLGNYLSPHSSQRAVGLHGLMLYKNHLDGTSGDLFIADGSGKKMIPVYLAK